MPSTSAMNCPNDVLDDCIASHRFCADRDAGNRNMLPGSLDHLLLIRAHLERLPVIEECPQGFLFRQVVNDRGIDQFAPEDCGWSIVQVDQPDLAELVGQLDCRTGHNLAANAGRIFDLLKGILADFDARETRSREVLALPLPDGRVLIRDVHGSFLYSCERSEKSRPEWMSRLPVEHDIFYVILESALSGGRELDFETVQDCYRLHIVKDIIDKAGDLRTDVEDSLFSGSVTFETLGGNPESRWLC